jgi:hypothetical protein
MNWRARRQLQKWVGVRSRKGGDLERNAGTISMKNGESVWRLLSQFGVREKAGNLDMNAGTISVEEGGVGSACFCMVWRSLKIPSGAQKLLATWI